MATKYYFLLFFFLLFYQDYSLNLPDRCQFYSENTVVIEVQKISEALRNSGYQIMATIIEKHLRSITPYCYDFIFFVDPLNRIHIDDDYTVTLFVPTDNAVRFKDWIDLEYQIVMSEVDEGAFKSEMLSEGSKLVPCSPSKDRLVVDRVFYNGTVSINSVKINKWNIYNDGRIIVHGILDFFNPSLGENSVRNHHWNIDPINTEDDSVKLFKDYEIGAYTPRKLY